MTSRAISPGKRSKRLSQPLDLPARFSRRYLEGSVGADQASLTRYPVEPDLIEPLETVSTESGMNLETATALAGLAVSMTWTPGPNNAMLSASGANYGWHRSVPHAMGVAIGFPMMLTLVALGLGQVIEPFPIVVKILKWLGCAMLAWFAWRIATAHATEGNDRSRPLTFFEAILFQWVNPAAWALAISLTAAYATGEVEVPNALLAASAFLVSGLASSYTWTVFGVGIGKALKQRWRLRSFNCAMGLALLSCAVWLLLEY